MIDDFISRFELDEIIKIALREDIGHNDITTNSTIPSNKEVKSYVVYKDKEKAIVCGIKLIKFIYNTLSDKFTFKQNFSDSDLVSNGDIIMNISGPARSTLVGERVAMNFLCRLSGIATLTRKYVDLVDNNIRICDTRKTTPGIRTLEKYAVRCGGGYNHRFSLEDGIIIKDNHIQIVGSIKEAVKRAREKNHHLIKIEVEAQNIDQVNEAIDSGADVIMLDNFSVSGVKKAIDLIDGRAKVEISGGIDLVNIKDYAKLDIDYISIGGLTHQAVSLDFSLEVEA